MRPMIVTGAATLAVVAGFVAPGASAQECVAPSIERALASCEGTRVESVNRPGRVPASLPTRRARASAPRERGPTLTSPTDLDPTAAQRQRRGRALLDRELEVLRRLVARSRPRDPRRGDALERLAITLDEVLQSDVVAARSLDEPIFEARQRQDAATAQRLVRRQRAAEAAAVTHREEAVRTLAALASEHPDRAGLDAALFALAHHLEAMQRAPQARQVYHRLIREHPASAYIPQAYLAFAEHAFAEGQLDAARQLYERVVAIPAERNPVLGYAQYKLAWVRYNLDDFRGALETFVRLIEHTRAHPDEPSSAPLSRAARRELVLPYARVGRPDRALAFFRRAACEGARPSAACEGEAYEMLDALGALYHDTGAWPESVAVHHQLMAERAGDDLLCAWQLRVLDAALASRPEAAQLEVAERSIALREAFVAADHPDEIERRCTDETASAVVLLATAWHRQAVGTDDQPGTRDRRTMERAAQLYARIDAALPELSTLELSAIDRRDRPSTAALAFYRGELLYELERYRECAEAYGRALDRAGEGELAADAAYGAVLCYDRHLGARTPPPTPADRALTERPLTEEEERMATIFARFACSAPTHEDLPVVLYRWARLYYEANQLERASVLFRRVAMDHPRSEVGAYAANLYLDALAMLAERRSRESCYAVIYDALDPLSTRYPEGEVAEVIGGLRCQIGARRAEALGRERAAAGGRAFVELARDGRCREHAPRYLYIAAHHFERARLLGRAIRVRTALAETFPDDPLARRAVSLIGANYHALAFYERAADYYERAAADTVPCVEEEGLEACPDLAEGLRHAVVFRLGLGDADHAIEDARAFERRFRASRPALAAEVVFAIGAIYEREERWDALVDHDRGFLRRYAHDATPTQLAQANVRVARALLAQGERDRATPHLRAAVAIHERGGDAAIAQLELAPADRERAALLLRDAVAEARYQIAEAARERYEAARFPAFRGAASVARVGQWSERELLPWMQQKLALFEEASALYDEVAPLGIPRWRIAAAARLGDMILDLVDRVRSSPVPDVIARDPELQAVYWEAIDIATEPYHRVAIERYEHCLATATASRWFDERSQRCEAALNRLDAARFPMAAELRGAPAYRPSTPAYPTPAVLEAREG